MCSYTVAQACAWPPACRVKQTQRDVGQPQHPLPKTLQPMAWAPPPLPGDQPAAPPGQPAAQQLPAAQPAPPPGPPPVPVVVQSVIHCARCDTAIPVFMDRAWGAHAWSIRGVVPRVDTRGNIIPYCGRCSAYRNLRCSVCKARWQYQAVTQCAACNSTVCYRCVHWVRQWRRLFPSCRQCQALADSDDDHEAADDWSEVSSESDGLGAGPHGWLRPNRGNPTINRPHYRTRRAPPILQRLGGSSAGRLYHAWFLRPQPGYRVVSVAETQTPVQPTISAATTEAQTTPLSFWDHLARFIARFCA